MTPDVLVVGGGVIALAIADALAREGLRVQVLESEQVGSGASGAAAGMLAPIYEAERPGPSFRLGLASLHRFEPFAGRLLEETGIDPEFERSGTLRLVANEADRQREATRRHALVEDADGAEGSEALRFGWLEGPELAAELSGCAPGMRGAFETPFECHVRPPLLVRALEAAARRRDVVVETGVRVDRLRLAGDRVVGVETQAGRLAAGAVVLAAGPWTPGVLSASGISIGARGALPIEPVRGQIVLLDAPLPPVRQMVAEEGIYCVPKRDGTWVVGATEERVGFDRRVTADGVAGLVRRAQELVPALAEATFVRAWAGLRPVSADGLPWIGPVSGVEGLWLAAGHGRKGVLLAPITAERLRDQLLGKRGAPPDDPFAPSAGRSSRFD